MTLHTSGTSDTGRLQALSVQLELQSITEWHGRLEIRSDGMRGCAQLRGGRPIRWGKQYGTASSVEGGLPMPRMGRKAPRTMRPPAHRIKPGVRPALHSVTVSRSGFGPGQARPAAGFAAPGQARPAAGFAALSVVMASCGSRCLLAARLPLRPLLLPLLVLRQLNRSCGPYRPCRACCKLRSERLSGPRPPLGPDLQHTQRESQSVHKVSPGW